MEIKEGDRVKYIDIERCKGKTIKVEKFGIWDGEKVVLEDKQKTTVRNKDWLEVVIFILYVDDGDEYNTPERKFENEVLPIRLYCVKEGCNKYVKGNEGYNGGFISETGHLIDLRNKELNCGDH